MLEICISAMFLIYFFKIHNKCSLCIIEFSPEHVNHTELNNFSDILVYGSDGCQITTDAADEILSEIKKLDIFSDMKRMEFDTGIKME